MRRSYSYANVRGRRVLVTALLPVLIAAASNLPADNNAGQQAPLLERFDQARSLFASRDREQAIPLFTEIIGELEQLRLIGDFSVRDRDLLSQALVFRARGRFLIDPQSPEVNIDLRRLIELNPNFEMPRAASGFLQRHQELRAQMVGVLQLSISPLGPWTRAFIDGLEIDRKHFGQPLRVLTGEHQIGIIRPGFDAYVEDFDMLLGSSVSVEAVLTRSSAVVRLMSKPAGVSVEVNGISKGETVATIDELSETGELIVEDVALGVASFRLVKDGYRPYVFELPIEAMTDYAPNPPVTVLELSQGTVVLNGVPVDATIQVDGEEIHAGRASATERPLLIASGDLDQLLLRPGSYTVTVESPHKGSFERSLNIVDGETLHLDIAFRPTVVFLGSFGGDSVGVRMLHTTLAETFSDFEDWTFIDRSDIGLAMVESLGIEIDALRKIYQDNITAEASGLDWKALQQSIQAELPGTVYVLGLLDDDMAASTASLWVWPAEPGPPAPELLTVPIANMAAGTEVLDAFVSSFDAPIRFFRPWFGALLIDSYASDYPLVVDVTPGGPAEAGGLQKGDQIVSIDDVDITMAADVAHALELIEGGASVRIVLRREEALIPLSLQLGLSPVVIPHDAPDLNYTALGAMLLGNPDQVAPGVPPWLVRLNQAAILLHSHQWGRALDTLREITNAPSGPGLGAAAVEYLKGYAFNMAGARYSSQARAAYTRAAGIAGGRLFHNDGPLIELRARARLALSGGAVSQ